MVLATLCKNLKSLTLPTAEINEFKGGEVGENGRLQKTLFVSHPGPCDSGMVWGHPGGPPRSTWVRGCIHPKGQLVQFSGDLSGCQVQVSAQFATSSTLIPVSLTDLGGVTQKIP